MARNDSKMFGCPACGFRVSSGEETCPRCGNGFNTETRFECPFCGELVERGAKSCQACHVDYAEFKEKTEARGGDDSIDSLLIEIIKLESTSVKQEDKRFGCPKCAWMLDGSEDKCPKCGETFSSDVSFQCPICGSSVTPESLKCPECGTGFGDEDSIASQHEGAEFSLEEIATAASDTRPESTEPAASEDHGSLQGKGKGDVSAMTDKISSIFGKIADAVKVDPEAEPPQPPPQEVEPAESIPAVPEPAAQAPAANSPTEEVSETQAEPEPAPESEAPKKTKTRKLKAKPQSGKPK